jgi:GWxTD domain-containing protein
MLWGRGFAADTRKLPPRYREWLEKDVTYIITQEEKQAFLRLAADADREKFIERFWELRNPSPGAPTNPYREDHYRRLTYANEHFGHHTGTPGWRTDQGRVYITLGEPQQKAVYYGYQKLRQMEIWFYSSTHPALPPFFYVVFYRPHESSDFRLYSPYIDGPEKLVTTDPGSRVQSLKVIDEQAGREVARTALSLLPDEPVDLDTARSSLQSDVMLGTIRNLANHHLTKERLAQRRALLESVTHRVILGGEFLNVLTVPLRNAEGEINLHYVLALQRPEDFTVGQAKDGRYYYALDVTARVFGSNNKLIFSQERSLSRYFSREELDRIKHRPLAYEGWLPIAPGKYKLEFLLTNKIRQTSFRAHREVEVPAVPARGIAMSSLVPFTEAEASGSSSAVLPFGGAGVRFTPVAQQVELAPGQDLKVFYQIWAPPITPTSAAGKKLLVEYAYGRPGMRADSKTIRDEVTREQFDPSGSMLNGKKIPLLEVLPGNYRLVVTVTDPESQQKAFGAMNFRVLNDAHYPPAWNIFDDELAESIRTGEAEYRRALCYIAAGNNDAAVEALRSALRKNPRHREVLARLVQLYFGKQAFTEVAGLYKQGGIDQDTDEQTILKIAESFERTGNVGQAVQLLESAIHMKGPSGPMYLTLASYYQRIGDTQKATETERKGKSLMAVSPSS